MGQISHSHWLHKSLSKALLIKILWFSSIVTFVLTANQLFIDYQSDIDGLRGTLEVVDSSHTQALINAVWDFDEEQINHQLSGLTKQPGIAQATLMYGNEFSETVRSGRDVANIFLTRKVTLERHIGDRSFIIGELEIIADVDGVRSKLFDKVLVVLASQGMKTFIVSLFILYIVNNMVVRHVESISEWLNDFRPESPFQPLDISPSRGDATEIDILARKVNEMGDASHKHTLGLEAEVLERTKELEEARVIAEGLARTDVLTGLNNRRAFFEFTQIIDHQARRQEHPYVVLMLDIDHFKSVNDTWGHEGGDIVLTKVGEIMKNAFRQSDIVGRVGGEEFAVMLPQTSVELGMQLADQLREQIASAHAQTPKGEIKVTASIGVADFNSTTATFEKVVAYADRAMYQAKHNGRNRVELYGG
ncbi:MAG: diguanylate cyclase [Sedimenticola sp.]